MTTVTRESFTLKGRIEARKRTPVTEKKDDTLQIVGRLVNYMAGGKDRSRFIMALIVRFGAVLALIAIPTLTGTAINVASDPNGTVAELQRWAGLAIGAGFVFLLLSVTAERVFSGLATHGLYNLQRDLFDHMQTLSLSFFDRQPLGELMSRVTNDTETVALFYESAVAQMIRALFQIMLIMVMMVLVNWRLTLVALLVVPVILVLTAVIQRISMPAFTKLQQELGQLSGFQEETISGQKVIISSRRHAWAEEKNEEQAGEVFDVASKAFFTSLLQFPLTQSMTMLQITLVLTFGSLMSLTGQANIGQVMTFVGFTGLLASPLSEIANLTATTLNAVAGGRRVFAIIDEQPTVVDDPQAADYAFKGGRVEFAEVDFSYVPGRKILKRNSFVAEPGQKIGICAAPPARARARSSTS
jgi:ABC-type multidrug transport system fused ATPase/permease subunit